jgi:hypothetical protein
VDPAGKLFMLGHFDRERQDLHSSRCNVSLHAIL